MSNGANYFSNAHDFHVENFTVVSASSSRLDEAFKLLHDNIAIDAAHNSDERCDAPTCYPETRKAVQAEILSWIGRGGEDHQPKKILWMSGPAGTGKTAIAGSLADTCDEQGLLAGSYFFASFTGSEKRRSKRYLVATLVYHLILPLDEQHPLRRAILSAVLRDPSVFRRRLKDQFRVLLVKPFHDTRRQFDDLSLPKVFIIDGLDEVEATGSRQLDQHEARLANEKDQEEILTALSYAVKDNTLPFRVIVGSRPERVIETFFATQGYRITRAVFLDEKYDPDSDIALFLNAEFAMIRRRYKLPSSWPSREAIQQLVDTSSGQFIYAATVVRFLQGTRQPDPKALLDTFLNWQSSDSAHNALTPLHALYTRILTSSADPYTAAHWLGVIHDLFESEPAFFLRQLLQRFEGQADHLFENLTSLVRVPPVGDTSSPYQLYHKSLADMLYSHGYVDWMISSAFRNGHYFLSSRCSAILRGRSPPIDELHMPQFMQYFARMLMHHWHPGNYEDEHAGLLVDCDVVWLIHNAVTTLTLGGHYMNLQEFIVAIFSRIHENCREHPGHCAPQCMHWRSNIFRVFKAWGWIVPNEEDLIIETMGWVAVGSLSQECISRCFTIPSNEAGPDISATLVSKPTSYTVDEEYKAMLDNVSKIFSHLPDGWIPKCQGEISSGAATVDNAFGSYIQKARLDLDSDISSDRGS